MNDQAINFSREIFSETDFLKFAVILSAAQAIDIDNLDVLLADEQAKLNLLSELKFFLKKSLGITDKYRITRGD